MPFNTLRFRYPWRPYQERVLKAVNEHLDDNRLHIVAALGAGKTTLGLEIFRIFGKPALALSPTRIICAQWIDRLKDFCEVEKPNTLDWVSNSNHQPKLFTSITYHALHAQFSVELAHKDV
jgi:superfamily II DNA or RNA helicase